MTYNEQDLLYDLATGMTYDDFNELYGMDVVQADRTIADLKHDHNIKRQKFDDEWQWVFAEPLEELLEE